MAYRWAENCDAVRQIESAFAGASRKCGVTLHEATVIDEYGTDEERASARLLDDESTWEDVPGDAIAENYSALSFLDPEGYRYYLPAYMRWSLHNFKRPSVSIEATVRSLDRTTSPFPERFALFTAVEIDAILAFLRVVVLQHDALEGDARLAIESWEPHARTVIAG